jgi:RNA-binding protein Musashi
MRGFFSKFGKVVDATVMVDRETGRSKGFGFVTFEDNSNDSQLVGKLGLILDDKQVRLHFISVVLRSFISFTRFRLK